MHVNVASVNCAIFTNHTIKMPLKTAKCVQGVSCCRRQIVRTLKQMCQFILIHAVVCLLSHRTSFVFHGINILLPITEVSQCFLVIIVKSFSVEYVDNILLPTLYHVPLGENVKQWLSVQTCTSAET